MSSKTSSLKALLRIRKLHSAILAQQSWQALKEALAYAISDYSYSPTHLRCLHARVISSGLHQNLYISTLLITKYFHFGDSTNARMVFDAQTQRPTKVIWNSMIKGYLKNGLPQLALDVYQEMTGRSLNCEPDKYTFHLAITACAQGSDLELGIRIGRHAREKGFESDLLVGTALISMYCKLGRLETARRMFDGMPERDVVSWNTMITGYSQAGFLFEALELFKEMRFVHGVIPTEPTLVSLVSGCGNLGTLSGGESIHAHVIKTGFEIYIFVSNSLIEMYIKCNSLVMAAALFNGMPSKDATSWSSMIGGYAQHGHPDDALKIFHRMVLNTGVQPTRPILLNVILACAELGDGMKGNWVEKNYISNGRFKADSVVITALIYMYTKCRKMENSLNLLNKVAEVRQDVIAWNAAIKACAELGQVDRVLELELEMQRRDISPNSVTFLMLLSLISSIPSLKKGTETHAQIVKRGFERENPLANSLISMYARSGSIGYSLKVFNTIQEKDVVSWSSIIQAYAWNGDVREALNLFELMKKTDVQPNHYTFLAALSACSHGGLVEEGLELFECMKVQYGLQPEIEHFTCMVDIVCRSARLTDAYYLLLNATSEHANNASLWGTMLSACRLHGDWVIGQAAARQLLLLEPRNAANYKMLADAYISAGMREDANGVLGQLRARELEKRPGCSWLDGS
ncbi:pentatricopeptide repeat-containing protein At5g27110-like [Typha angustifolia]|uniref:pentatricopeptide repeat-containing protein At5g27110-like n=1 Tax=Typha angustifolia TaxID=59011 RepID=UPI003C2F899A